LNHKSLHHYTVLKSKSLLFKSKLFGIAGFVGGSYYKDSGGGVNYQCMPPDPQYNRVNTGSFYGSWISGTEYESNYYGIFSNSAHDQNVPCARCYTENRPALMMIPAKRSCPSGWTQEYEGNSQYKTKLFLLSTNSNRTFVNCSL